MPAVPVIAPGSTAPGRWQARLGIRGSVDADPTSVVVLAGARDGEVPWSGLLRLRLARLLARDLSAPVAALARGMALGDRSGISPQVNDAFRNGGTIHILSISGLHVCVLAGIVAAMAVAFRVPATPALWLELLSLWGYVLLVGAPASAVRSAILWSAMRAGRMRGAPVRPFARAPASAGTCGVRARPSGTVEGEWLRYVFASPGSRPDIASPSDVSWRSMARSWSRCCSLR